MNKPLPYRMRPSKLENIIGQEQIVGPNGFFTNLIKNQTLVSTILYGPPGTGKTTIAQAFCNSMDVHFIKLNATISTKQDLINAFQEAKFYKDTVLIIDEIHRLNKDKQDLLLPKLEDGSIYLIGATTANPMLAINPAIRSRTHLLEVKPLNVDQILIGLKKACISPEGLNNSRQFDEEALKVIARTSGGDLRYAYNLLEATSLSFSKDHLITVEDVLSINSIPNFYADKDENEHYDTVSAFQKSIRGSQVDAALYYLGKLIESNDLEGIIRRLLVIAYEDIGLGNPQAVDRCLNACNVAREVGFPEASIPLSVTVVDLALSPKSRSACDGIEKVLSTINDYPTQVRDYLKYTPVNVNQEDKYPYSRPDLWKYIQYMPQGLEDVKFYKPNPSGNYERSLITNYQELEKIKRSTSIRDLLKSKKD